MRKIHYSAPMYLVAFAVIKIVASSAFPHSLLMNSCTGAAASRAAHKKNVVKATHDPAVNSSVNLCITLGKTAGRAHVFEQKIANIIRSVFYELKRI